jgi:alkaline phosphatase D
VIATELCGTSVTSNSRPQSRTDRYVADNPHIKYGRSDRRGYMMLEVKPERVSARFQALDDVRFADSGVSTAASFIIEDGRPRLQKA